MQMRLMINAHQGKLLQRICSIILRKRVKQYSGHAESLQNNGYGINFVYSETTKQHV